MSSSSSLSGMRPDRLRRDPRPVCRFHTPEPPEGRRFRIGRISQARETPHVRRAYLGADVVEAQVDGSGAHGSYRVEALAQHHRRQIRRASCAEKRFRRDGPALTHESTGDASEGRLICQPSGSVRHAGSGGNQRRSSLGPRVVSAGRLRLVGRRRPGRQWSVAQSRGGSRGRVPRGGRAPTTRGRGCAGRPRPPQRRPRSTRHTSMPPGASTAVGCTALARPRPPDAEHFDTPRP